MFSSSFLKSVLCFKHHLLQEAFPDLPRVPPWGSQCKSLLITCLLLLFQGRAHGVCSSLDVGIDSLVRDVCTTLTPANTWKFTSNKSTACLGLWIGDRSRPCALAGGDHFSHRLPPIHETGHVPKSPHTSPQELYGQCYVIPSEPTKPVSHRPHIHD